MKRVAGAMLCAVLVGGCTTVRVVKREGCWVRQTDRFLQGTQEEMGPCARQAPQWVDDRLTRLVQECVAAADYRWQSQALAAWSAGDKLPPRDPDESVLQTCMAEATRTMVTENEALRTRLGEVQEDRAALAASVEKGQEHLRQHNDRLAVALGEAAKRPEQAATATATASSDSKGSSSTESGTSALTSYAGEVPVRPAALPVCAPPAASAQPVTRVKRTKPAPAPKAPACPPGSAPSSAEPVRSATPAPAPEGRTSAEVPLLKVAAPASCEPTPRTPACEAAPTGR